MLFQAEMMSVIAHMMLAFPRETKLGKTCCEILGIPANAQSKENLSLSDRTIVQDRKLLHTILSLKHT